MPSCPSKSSLHLEGPCPNTRCYNYVPTLDYCCLPLHGSIYGKSPSDILASLYGKSYKMTVALSIKASRIAYALKGLEHRPSRDISPFEGTWCSRVVSAGPVDPRLHWTELTKQNEGKKFTDRMLQVLNTMEVHEYSLAEVLTSYKSTFRTLDFAAFALQDTDAESVEQLIRSLRWT